MRKKQLEREHKFLMEEFVRQSELLVEIGRVFQMQGEFNGGVKDFVGQQEVYNKALKDFLEQQDLFNKQLVGEGGPIMLMAEELDRQRGPRFI